MDFPVRIYFLENIEVLGINKTDRVSVHHFSLNMSLSPLGPSTMTFMFKSTKEKGRFSKMSAGARF